MEWEEIDLSLTYLVYPRQKIKKILNVFGSLSGPNQNQKKYKLCSEKRFYNKIKSTFIGQLLKFFTGEPTVLK